MSIQEITVLEKLSERLGINPDKELTPRELAVQTGVSVQLWQIRRDNNAIWAKAFYKVGAKDHRTTMRRIWSAQDELAKQGIQQMKKAA